MNIGTRKLAFLFVFCLVPVYWIALTAPATGVYHDDGIYLVTAKSLAEGSGYRIISLPNDIPQTKYPPLFPSLLALVWSLFPNFPDNLVFLKLVPLLFSILWILATYKFLSQLLHDNKIALWISFIVAASPQVIFFSSSILSETTFSFFAVLALYFMFQTEDMLTNRNLVYVFLSALFASAAFMTRTIGVSLLFSGLFVLLARRQYKMAALFSISCGMLISPWLLWQFSQNSDRFEYHNYYALSNYQDWNILFSYKIGEKIIVLLTNIIYLLFCPTHIYSLNIPVFNIVFSLSFMLLTIIGYIIDIRNKLTPINCFVAIYVGIFLCWLWPPTRFIIPIFPFFIYYGLKGMSFVIDQYSRFPKTGFISVLLSITLSVSIGLSVVWSSLETIRKSHASIAYVESDNWLQIRNMLDWLKNNSDKNSIILGIQDPTYYLYTGRKSIRGFVLDPYKMWYTPRPEDPIGSVSRFLNTIDKHRVDYIVRSPSMFFCEGKYYNKIIDEIVYKYPTLLKSEKLGLDPGYMLYKVNFTDLDHIINK